MLLTFLRKQPRPFWGPINPRLDLLWAFLSPPQSRGWVCPAVSMQPDGYTQGVGNTGEGLGPFAGSFPGEGNAGLGASLGLSMLTAAEVAQKRIFPNYLYFRSEERREMRREKEKKRRK